MTLSPDSVRSSLSRINARKALGPDNIPRRVLRDCAVELTDVFTDIFNISLSQAVVPTCFKATTIIPVPKKSSPSCFNDYRPVALTPILMKCFERLVMQHIKSVPPPPPWTPSSLHIGPIARPMMPSPLPSTQPSHIWTKRTRMCNINTGRIRIIQNGWHFYIKCKRELTRGCSPCCPLG